MDIYVQSLVVVFVSCLIIYVVADGLYGLMLDLGASYAVRRRGRALGYTDEQIEKDKQINLYKASLNHYRRRY